MLVIAVWVLASGCRGDKSTAPPSVGSLLIGGAPTTLQFGQTVQLTATVLSTAGAPLAGRTVTWTSSNETVATVSGTGLVTGGAVRGAVLEPVIITVTCEGSTATATISVAPMPVTTVTLFPTDVALLAGHSAHLVATAGDATGAALTGRTVTWSSTAPEVATVSEEGRVTGLAPGSATINATVGARSGSASIIVRLNTIDVAIGDAAWTQAVQRGGRGGQIPMILDGAPAALNVVVQANDLKAFPSTLVLRLTDTAGRVVHSDTVRAVVPSAGASLATPNAQFLVPAAWLRPGIRWQVLRDPLGLTPDVNPRNDRFPETSSPLQTVSVPPLLVRFVPIILATHGGTIGDVTTSNLPEYLRSLQAFMPVGRVEATVGAPFTTTASFGTPPSGGESSFWVSVLSELNLARLADATSAGRHWYGVVRPPAGFTSVANGGWALIGTPTAVGVQVGWFNRETQASELVAHELGHNFGRRHSPCGGAGQPLDPGYPLAGGVAGPFGHDVLGWASGQATKAAAIDSTRGDVMGYCFPPWISPYTYEGILASRGPVAIVPGGASIRSAESVRTRVLAVRGTITAGAVTLDPAISLLAEPTRDDGPIRVELLDANGRVLTSRRTMPMEVDHASTHLFVATIPLVESIARRTDAVRVDVPGIGEARLTSMVLDTVTPPAWRSLAGRNTVVCGDPRSRAIAVTDPFSGALLAIGRGAQSSVPARSSVVVLCSDGVRTVSRLLR
jgi:hypothetical protein